MLFLIQKISFGWCDFLHIVFSKIKVINGTGTLCICCKSCNKVSSLKDYSCFPVRMNNVLTGIQSIYCSFKLCIALWNCFSGFLINLENLNLCSSSVILECVGKSCLCLILRHYIEIETVNIIAVTDIIYRCFSLCDIEAIADWKVYGVSCLSISPGCYCLKCSSLSNNHPSIIVFDVISCIKSVLTAC